MRRKKKRLIATFIITLFFLSNTCGIFGGMVHAADIVADG